jgi:hypothetical protein
MLTRRGSAPRSGLSGGANAHADPQKIWQIQAAVVSKMLEQAGFTVGLQILDATVYNRKTFLSDVD